MSFAAPHVPSFGSFRILQSWPHIIFLCTATAFSSSALASSGFEVDSTVDEVKKTFNRIELRDLAVGDSAIISAFAKSCRINDGHHLYALQPITERSKYSSDWIVTRLPDNKVDLVVSHGINVSDPKENLQNALFHYFSIL